MPIDQDYICFREEMTRRNQIICDLKHLENQYKRTRLDMLSHLRNVEDFLERESKKWNEEFTRISKE